MLTPKAYLQRYKALEVYLYTDEQARAAKPGMLPAGGEWRAVDVSGYRLGLKLAYQSTQTAMDKFHALIRPQFEGKDAAITVWVKTEEGNVAVRTYRNRQELFERTTDPFYGKGAPEEVQIVLQLAVRFGLFTRDQIQIYCTNGNIGLDCNGFVGNYLRHAMQGHSWDTDAGKKSDIDQEFDASSGIINILKPGARAQQVKTFDDILRNRGDIFVFALVNKSDKVFDRITKDDGSEGVGHIMITEPHTAKMTKAPALGGGIKASGETLEIMVVESTGGLGPVSSQYHLLDVDKNGVFTVYRGSKQSKSRMAIVRMLKQAA